jgi:co-chaperonin GroES (HSP10)
MIKPVGEMILVDLLKQQEKSKGGIILVNNDNEGYLRGSVLAIGESEKIKFKVGDVAIMPKELKYIKIDGNTILASYTNVLAVE